MRSLLACCLVLGIACTGPPTGEPGLPPRATGDDEIALAWAPSQLSPELPEGDDDDDDDDDDDIVIEEPDMPPCPDPTEPLPKSAFADVSTCAGVVATTGAAPPIDITGQAWADVDGDGDIDLFVTDPTGSNSLFLNDGNGLFDLSPDNDDVALPETYSSGATFADYDNDGDPDLHVLAMGPDVLLRNDEDEGWTDVTEEAGLENPAYGMSAAWADFDGDGWLDLYITNYPCSECEGLAAELDGVDLLFRSQGDGTFEDFSRQLDGELLYGAGYAVVWLDYDNDGDPDLYVGNDRGSTEPWEPGETVLRNLMFRNEGPGCGGACFEEVAEEIGADLRIDSMGIAVADYDQDGWLDLAVSDGGPPRLLRNLMGSFVDVTLVAGLEGAEVADGWGLVFLDYNNDGYPDLYLADGLTSEQPNWLFRNNGDGGFSDVSEGSGAQLSGHSAGVASADYDGDGWVDLLVGNREGGYQLLRNLPSTEPAPSWIRFRLAGAGSTNGDAVGARAVLKVSKGPDLIQEVKLGSSVGSSNDPALHFGLGSQEISQVTIEWPDGAETELEPASLDQELLVLHPGP